MNNELLGENVPEQGRRGGGSGIWSRYEKSPLGEVFVTHWRLSSGDCTELGIRNFYSCQIFPSIYLAGHIECKDINIFDLYIRHFFKLGTPELLVSILNRSTKQARKEGAEVAKMQLRKALGIEE